MCVSMQSKVLWETLRESCVFMIRFHVLQRCPFRKWQVGEGMFCGSKKVQNTDTKDIMSSQTELAVKITKVPMSPARKKMDRGYKAEIMRFVVRAEVSVG